LELNTVLKANNIKDLIMKTRIILTVLFAFFSLVYLQAQEGSDEEMKMLFKKKEKKESDGKMANGGYGSFSIGYTRIDNKDAMVIGGRAAWIANHRFALGLAGRGFFNNVSANRYYDPNYNPNYDPNYSLAGGYGGIFFEPIVAWSHPVNVSFPILIGAGGVAATPTNWAYAESYYSSNYYYQTDAYFVFEPGVDLQFNIAKFFRIALGASYRYTSDVYLQHKYLNNLDETVYVTVPKDALRNFNVDISFKFGWF
jgi:hypothetical protein